MDLNDEIAKVAYELYERDGRQNGKDQEHWLEAEKIVKARLEQSRAPKAPIEAPAERKKAPAEPKKAPGKSLVTRKEALPRAASTAKAVKKAPVKKAVK